MTLRAPLAVLNELSVPASEQQYDVPGAARLLADLTELLRACVAIRPDLVLVSSLPLAGTPMTGEGLSFGAVAQRRGGLALDQWRYVRSRQNIAPFSVARDLPVEDLGTEWHFDDRRCVGLGLAATAGQLAISLASDSCWSASAIALQRSVVVEAGNELLVEQNPVVVKHASSTEHVTAHRDFIANLALPTPFSGQDLWADRKHRYPSLQFLPRVENQVRRLPHGAEWVSSIHGRLDELDRTVREWDPKTDLSPRWLSHVTPEHEQRKRLCEFTDDIDGKVHCFDLHARFTPGAGRIHFRIVNGNPPSLRIAHVGEKLN